MASKYESNVVREPLYENFPAVKNRQSPPMTFMSARQVPGARHSVRLGWITGMPDPNPHVFEHTHPYDEIIHYWGGNAATPQVLGGEIEFYIGGQPVTFNTTTCIFIPRGTPHGPVTWKKFQFPHVEMVLTLNEGQPAEDPAIFRPKKALPKKTANFDYEQYAVRSPMREAAIGFKGLQSPSMTYMSSIQVNQANLYIDWAWVYDIVAPAIGEHMHNNNDEIVLHLGGDPASHGPGGGHDVRLRRRHAQVQPELRRLHAQGTAPRPATLAKGAEAARRNGHRHRRGHLQRARRG